ncbi:helix-turn-helix transcriptional regulator [Cerasibacillus terrae]|nr:helix-turn-helix transcriptional regulator [Cerasibacillus terrae]
MKIKLKNKKRFQMILIEKGYTQRAFSKNIGMSENYVNQIINYKKHPSPAVAMKIASVLELDFNDVFDVSN